MQSAPWLKMFLKYLSPFYEDLRPIRIFLFQSQLCHRPASCLTSGNSYLSGLTTIFVTQRAAQRCMKESPGVPVKEINPQVLPQPHWHRVSRRSIWTMESTSCHQISLGSSHSMVSKVLIIVNDSPFSLRVSLEVLNQQNLCLMDWEWLQIL